jgi:hypothetical protein
MEFSLDAVQQKNHTVEKRPPVTLVSCGRDNQGTTSLPFIISDDSGLNLLARLGREEKVLNLPPTTAATGTCSDDVVSAPTTSLVNITDSKEHCLVTSEEKVDSVEEASYDEFLNKLRFEEDVLSDETSSTSVTKPASSEDHSLVTLEEEEQKVAHHSLVTLEEEDQKVARTTQDTLGNFLGDALDTQQQEKYDTVTANTFTSSLPAFLPEDTVAASTTTLNKTKIVRTHEEVGGKPCLTSSGWVGETTPPLPSAVVTPPVSPGDGSAECSIVNVSTVTTEESACKMLPGDSLAGNGASAEFEISLSLQKTLPESINISTEHKEEKVEKDGTQLKCSQSQPQRSEESSRLCGDSTRLFKRLCSVTQTIVAMKGSAVKIVPILCAVLTFAIHANTIVTGEFVWDDRAAVLANPDVLGKRNLLGLLRHDFWGQDMRLEVGSSYSCSLSYISQSSSCCLYSSCIRQAISRGAQFRCCRSA